MVEVHESMRPRAAPHIWPYERTTMAEIVAREEELFLDAIDRGSPPRVAALVAGWTKEYGRWFMEDLAADLGECADD